MSDAAPARTLRAGRYVIIGELGAGSQAETLDAVDKQRGRAVAIKRFQVRGAKSWKDVELAEREARVLSTLTHPNLPVYVEHFEEDGALYLVMEKIEGETLASLRKRRALLSNDDLARFLSDAELTLDYLHSRVPPIIHRDIKPGNVIRRADGSFAFVDFGSVRDQLKPEGGSTVVGTFGYMAPEQFQGRALPGSDVYAVAATALALATGREPEDLPHRGLSIDVPAALGSGAEPWLVRALSTMLEPDPDKRPRRVSARRSTTSNAARDGTRTERRERERAERASQRATTGSAWQSPDFTDLRGIREQGRAQREQMKAEGRRLRRELKQQIRDETRRVRRQAREYRRSRPEQWQGRPPGFGPAAPLLLSLIVLGLTLARVATFALFRVFLPTLLGILAIFFGRGLRRAAWRCREIGVRGDRGLLHAIDAVRGRITGRADFDVDGEPAPREDAQARNDVEPPPPVQPPPRTRVSSAPARVADVDAELEEPDDAPLSRREQR